jgi:hypothetical protein|tara:strand:- start:80 stop:805 length:726 start_codon:yes stop_codon:yes gene_type:complete
MKKFFTLALIAAFLIPSNLKAQKDKGAAIAGGLLAIGAGIAAIEQLKEQLEQKAVENVLSAYPHLVDFELKTGSLKGTKFKDLSSVGVVTFEIKDLNTQYKYVLFAFLSGGWSNQFGVDFNKIKWKLFTKDEWNKLMQAYIRTASKKDISINDVAISKIVNKGVQRGGKYIVEFSKIKGDVYYTNDYSDEFKIVFNERSLGLYLKQKDVEDQFRTGGGPRGDLVQIRRKAIIRAHSFLNFN